jgi:hypothetical protein
MPIKCIFVLLFFPFTVFAQCDNYVSLLKEADNYISNNFISPFLNKDIKFIHDSYWGFGFKRDIFTNDIRFSNFGVILCNVDEHIYSMDDGIVVEIGYDEDGFFVLIKYDEIYVYYYRVDDVNIKEGDTIEKGKLIGKIKRSYQSIGPLLILKIKYKDYYFNPYFLLDRIVYYK